jgi:hypothetical protein
LIECREVLGRERVEWKGGRHHGMPPTVTLRLPSGEVQAVELTFEAAREEWNEYRLADGGTVRVKAVVSKIYRLLDAAGNPAYDQAGDPHIAVNATTLIVASEAQQGGTHA